MDGTLVTFRFDIQGTRAALLAEMQNGGFDVSGLSLTSPTQAILDSARNQAEQRGQDYRIFKSKVYSVLDAFEIESASSTAAFPGTREELLYLKSKGVRLAVLTNSGRVAAAEVLARANLEDCFEFVLTRDETEEMKPRPDGLRKAVSMLQLPRESVYYVGDSPYDIEAAKGAGVRTISIATGNYTKDRLQSEGAEFVISEISELRKVLGV
jgi:HAD superfamily hydrolase (TIGR01549 family)